MSDSGFIFEGFFRLETGIRLPAFHNERSSKIIFDPIRSAQTTCQRSITIRKVELQLKI